MKNNVSLIFNIYENTIATKNFFLKIQLKKFQNKKIEFNFQIQLSKIQLSMSRSLLNEEPHLPTVDILIIPCYLRMIQVFSF